MTQTIFIRTSSTALFSLLLCSSIVLAKDGAATAGENPVENRSVSDVEPESIAAVTTAMPVEHNVQQLTPAEKQSNATTPQARPGERVTNPDHLILNSDTTLGGVEVKGPKLNDFGYLGPGDMRTHLWNGHANELIANGITEHKLMAMTVPEVQQWHNYFHGAEGSPEQHHDDGEQSHLVTIVEQPAMLQSPNYVGDSVHETNFHENSGFNDAGYPQLADGEAEMIDEKEFVIQGTMIYESKNPMESNLLNP